MPVFHWHPVAGVNETRNKCPYFSDTLLPWYETWNICPYFSDTLLLVNQSRSLDHQMERNPRISRQNKEQTNTNKQTDTNKHKQTQTQTNTNKHKHKQTQTNTNKHLTNKLSLKLTNIWVDITHILTTNVNVNRHWTTNVLSAVCLCDYVSFRLSISICLCVCLFVGLSIYLFVFLFYQSVCVSVCLSVYLCACLSVCLWVCLTDVCMYRCSWGPRLTAARSTRLRPSHLEGSTSYSIKLL